MKREVLTEKFFTCLISGDRIGARALVDEVIDAECPAEQILSRLFWPALDQVQKLHRADQLSNLSHNYATRILRSLVEQMQLRLTRKELRGQTVLVTCGDDQGEELAAMMSADLLEAEGYTVYFAGGGIANDELVTQVGQVNADILLVFGAVPSSVPFTRLLIDHLHDIGVCPRLQIVVGGGVFNRADGLAEEIGADLWAADPEQLVEAIKSAPEQRAMPEQRTVGRKRRTKRDAA